VNFIYSNISENHLQNVKNTYIYLFVVKNSYSKLSESGLKCQN